MLRLAPAAALALTCAPALACPVSLGEGVLLVSSDQSVALLSPGAAPGEFEERVTYDGESGYVMRGLFGVYTLETVQTLLGVEDEATREIAVFDPAPPPPEPGQMLPRVVAQVTLNGATFERVHQVTAGAPTRIAIGPCTYDGFPIQVQVDDIDAPRRLLLFYIQAFGLAVFTGYEDSYGAEGYELVSIEPVSALGIAGE
jgi:hypothetical protein